MPTYVCEKCCRSVESIHYLKRDERWRKCPKCRSAMELVDGKAEMYRTAKIKDSAPINHAGEFVGLADNINGVLFRCMFIGGGYEWLHKCHLENFVL